MQPLPWETTSLVLLWVCMCGPQRTFLPRNTAGNRESHLLCLMGGGLETWSWLVLPKALGGGGGGKVGRLSFASPCPCPCVVSSPSFYWAMLVTGVGSTLVFIDYAVRQDCKSPWLAVSEGTG